MPVCKVDWKMGRTDLSHNRMFWTLPEWWQSACCTNKTNRDMSNRMQSAKRQLMNRFKFRDCDWTEVSVAGQDRRYGNKLLRATTRALLANLVLWACNVENDMSSLTPMHLMQGLLDFSFKKCAWKLFGHVRCMEDAGGSPYAARLE